MDTRNVTCTTTAQSLGNGTRKDSRRCRKITLFAADDNTPVIYYGNAAAQNFPLKKGDSIDIENTPLSEVYVRSASATATLYVQPVW